MGIFGLFKKNAVVKLTPLVENYKKEEKVNRNSMWLE